LFSERGYHATGLKEVAERCEFSVGSIYQFFDSKDTLHEGVLLRRGYPMREEMARIASSAEPADEQLLAMAEQVSDDPEDYPAAEFLSFIAQTFMRRPLS
jgi:TetR/AcrR family transcriptional regulator